MKIVSLHKIIPCFLFLLLLQNCATVFNGGSQYIVAAPSKEEADGVPVRIEVDAGAYKSKLPATIVTKPSSFNDVIIELNHPAYLEERVKVTKSVAPSFWVNVIFIPIGLIGMSVDYYTGYMWKLDRQIIIPTEKRILR